MFMKACLVVLSIGLASAAQAGGPVAAASEPEVKAAAAPMADLSWTGVYVGVNVTNGSLDDGILTYDPSGNGVQAGYLRDLGAVVAGVELSYSQGDLGGSLSAFDFDATRLKLVGGYDAGRFMPYAFVGATRYKVSFGPTSNADTMMNYGIGARVALGTSGDVRVGAEYLIEKNDKFGISDVKLDGREVSLRLEYRF
jgi:outer membrane immunogenic protein